MYLEANYLVPGRLCNLEHHLVALKLAGEIVGVMMMEQMMTMTMIVDGEDNHRDDNLDMIMAIIVDGDDNHEDDDSDNHDNDSG